MHANSDANINSYMETPEETRANMTISRAQGSKDLNASLIAEY